MQRTIFLAIIAMASACGSLPGFQASLPDRIAVEGKSIVVIGDLQQTSGVVRFLRGREDTAAQQDRLLADLESHIETLAALVIVGDLVFSARSQRDWEHFDELIEPFAARMPILPAIGNHDYPCYLVRLCRTANLATGMQQRFPWFEPGQPYAVPADELLLLFLDSESELDAQSAWLASQLESAAEKFSAALVFFHRPPYSNSIERSAKGDPDVQRFVVPVLHDSPVPTVVVNGHIHGFEHLEFDGVHFITTAGGGGPRVAMPKTGSADLYRGPECELPESASVVRPFNYLIVTPLPGRLSIEVRGFCTDNEPVRSLDFFTIES